MTLLFLDIDGVLNDHENDPEIMCGQIHREKVRLLNGILRSTGAKIVLSSAWRYIVYRGEATLMGMEWLLRSHGLLANRLYGITRQDTLIKRGEFDGKIHWPVDNERGQQIADWLCNFAAQGHAISKYIVIDDLDLGISAAGHPFVRTNGSVGLTESDADQVIQMLKGSTT